jgi:transketolase
MEQTTKNLDNRNIKKIKKNIINISINTNSAHIGSNLSCLEILYSIFKINKKKDNVILSKGHAAIAYYAVLEHFKILEKKYINNFLKKNSVLWSHISSNKKLGFQYSFGSLGYGLGISAGLAYKTKKKVYCILSDGELNEGSVWESLLFISHHKLNNLIILLDNNKLQSFGFTKDVLNIKINQLHKLLNFKILQCNGHSIREIIKCIKHKNKKPKIIICHTVKGKGIKRIENKLASHYHAPILNDLNYYNEK